MSNEPAPPTYGAVAAELLRQGLHGGPGLHMEIDPPPQPGWVAAVEDLLETAQSWELSRGNTPEIVGQADELLQSALDQLRKAWT